MTGFRLGYMTAPTLTGRHTLLRKIQEPLVASTGDPDPVGRARGASRRGDNRVDAGRVPAPARPRAIDSASGRDWSTTRRRAPSTILADIASTGMSAEDFALRSSREHRVAVAAASGFALAPPHRSGWAPDRR